MKLPQTSTPIFAAALLGAMGLAFVFLGLSEGFPPAYLGAALFFIGAAIAIRRAMRKSNA